MEINADQTDPVGVIDNISTLKLIKKYIIQICSGITRGRVLKGELYAQRF